MRRHGAAAVIQAPVVEPAAMAYYFVQTTHVLKAGTYIRSFHTYVINATPVKRAD